MMIVSLVVMAGGCMFHSVEVEPVRVAPIHMTVDVNVHVDEAEGQEEPTSASD